MISVVIPLYNKESQIANTLRSVLRQTYKDFEIVVVDDGSTDHSVDEVKKVNDSRIRIISQENGGVSEARNRGIHEAKGEYIAFLDADDEWHQEYLSTQNQLINSYSECSVFATNYQYSDSKGRFIPAKIKQLPFTGSSGILSNYFTIASRSTPPLWTSAIVVTKKAITSIVGFPNNIKSGEDLLTWARLACKYQIAYSCLIRATFIYNEDLFNEDQKNRQVSVRDEVGTGLVELMHIYKTEGLREYIALWYKMRTRIALSKNQRSLALKEGLKSLKYNINSKTLVFLAMCFLPYTLNQKLFKKFG